ncbi:3-oxoacyl-ACP reductase FabG [Kaarinaea lacus]
MDTNRKRALVTGGSGGIGSAICRRLASDGYFVYVHANRNTEQAQSVVEQINTSGGEAEAISFDVTSTSQSEEILQSLVENMPIQVLVNNAGIHNDAPLAGMKPEQWQSVIDVSLNGFYNVTRPLLLPMMGTRWGRIISISSVAGVIGNRGQANYAAAKSGLHGASRSLALEVASRGITVNVVAPGVIETEMIDDAFDKKTIKTLVPMQRAGKPDEVAAVVGFLCSEDAGYVSGQVIGVDGALT